VLNLSACENGGCYGANDLGTTYSLDVPSSGTLLRTTPKSKQVTPWVTNNVIVAGVPSQKNYSEYTDPGILRLYINGIWNPWGYDISNTAKMCVPGNCPTTYVDSNIYYGPNLKECLYVTRGENDTNIPCALKNGMGLYGLISLNGDDPNDKKYWDGNYPGDKFRTFHLGAYPVELDLDGKPFIKITKTMQCDADNCIVDTTPDGQEYIKGGKLYFKIYDNYYSDNIGGYSITVASGATGPTGPIQQFIESFYKGLLKISATLVNKLVHETKLIGIIRSMLLLYVAITGLMFALGLIRANVGEVFTRIFKIGLLLTIISPGGFAFFYNNFFILFTKGADSIAQIILESTFYYDSTLSARFPVRPNSSVLSIFDIFFGVIFSPALHYKILAVLGTIFRFQADFLFFPIIYFGVFLIVVATLKAVLMYTTSLVFIGILIAISPIFFAMILFQLTFQYFKQWLDMLVSNAVMIIMVSGVLTMMVLLVFGRLEELLMFKACSQRVFWSQIPIYAFVPDSLAAMRNVLNYKTIATFLLVAILFNAFMDQVPHMVDSICGLQLTPLSSAFGQSWGIGAGVFAGVWSGISAGRTALGNAATSGLDMLASRSSTYRAIKKGVASIGTQYGEFKKEHEIIGKILDNTVHKIPTSAADVAKLSEKVEKTFGLQDQSNEDLVKGDYGGKAYKKTKEAAKYAKEKGGEAVKKVRDWWNA
jgi:type IV secretory pathway VirB6-like protein